MVAPAVRPRIVAVDPGPEKSGVVLYDPEISEPVVWAAVSANDDLLHLLAIHALPCDGGDGSPCELSPANHVLVVESMVPRGQPVYRQTMETLVWIGRFIQAWDGPHVLLDRESVKRRLVQSSTAGVGDAHVRAAIMERFGGPEKAKGRKAAPGPLYHVKSHAMAALALAVAHSEGE